jgi:hypothetical protein
MHRSEVPICCEVDLMHYFDTFFLTRSIAGK